MRFSSRGLRILSVLRRLIPYIFTLVLFFTGFSFSNAAEDKTIETNIAVFPFAAKPPCDPLQPTLIDSVSVNPLTGAITVSWYQNPSPAVDYYVVYVYNPLTSPPWDAVDTVFGAANLSSVITSYNSASGSHTFAVSAHDNCGNSSFFSLDDAHNTIFLETQYNACELEVNLKWNKYKNWQNEVVNYKIWSSVNGGTFQLIGLTANTDTSFKHSGVTPQANICYYIQAIENVTNKTSGSNKVCFITDFSDSPAFSYIRYASVTGPTSVKIAAYVDVSANVSKYVIERRIFGAFSTIDQVLPSQLNGDLLEYIDNDVNTNENSYTYRFKTINNCNKESGISNEAKTILLKIENNNDAMINTLTWSDYKTWGGGVESYNIYRGIDGIYSKIDNVSSTINFYQDNVAEFYSSNGEFCYYIQAVEDLGNVHAFKEVSSSNQKCVEQKPFMYVPNAFTPGGSNPVFKPVFSYVEPSSYHFIIFNRWGEKFFETTDTQVGWDGGAAPTGVYIYQIKYGSAFGQSYTKTGNVTLLR